MKLDATMCRDDACPLSVRCRRFLSRTNDRREYYSESPRNLDAAPRAAPVDICPAFWPVRDDHAEELVAVSAS